MRIVLDDDSEVVVFTHHMHGHWLAVDRPDTPLETLFPVGIGTCEKDAIEDLQRQMNDELRRRAGSGAGGPG